MCWIYDLMNIKAFIVMLEYFPQKSLSGEQLEL